MDGIYTRNVVEIVIFDVVFVQTFCTYTRFAPGVFGSRRFPGAKAVQRDRIALLRGGDDGESSGIWFARFLLVHGVRNGDGTTSFAPVFFRVPSSLRG